MSKQLEMQQKREKMLHQIKEFRLLDDDFMTKCFENNREATELVLRIYCRRVMKLIIYPKPM